MFNLPYTSCSVGTKKNDNFEFESLLETTIINMSTWCHFLTFERMLRFYYEKQVQEQVHCEILRICASVQGARRACTHTSPRATFLWSYPIWYYSTIVISAQQIAMQYKDQEQT